MESAEEIKKDRDRAVRLLAHVYEYAQLFVEAGCNCPRCVALSEADTYLYQKRKEGVIHNDGVRREATEGSTNKD